MSNDARSAKPGWFRGAAVDLSRKICILMFLALLLISACLCFSQFGIMSWGTDLSRELSFVLFLGPVALCVVMLGAVPGVALAFITSILIMVRSWWTPTTIYDFQMSDPFLSVASITIGAILMAAIVTPAARKWPPDPAIGVKTSKRIGAPRITSIVIGCLVLAFTFSYGTRGLLYLFVTPGGAEYNYAETIQGYLSSLSSPLVFLEAVLNGAILSIACIWSVSSDASRRTGRLSGSWGFSLHVVFAQWLAFSMFIVFLLASSVSFCVETVTASEDADEQIMSELRYLQQQVASHKEDSSVESIANGFSTVFGGTVMVIRDHTIVSSNDPNCVGKSAGELIGSDGIDNYDFLVQQAATNMITGYDESTKEFQACRALLDDYYAYVAIEPLSKMYRARTGALLYNAGFMLTVLLVVFFVVRELLNRIVVAPIHRTNETLGHITHGELARRVNERNVIEFDELSTGINATVAALKDNIDEVAQRNAQDLMAAKAIQESALPRKFPPFPDIDRFDIYASMKTAKEVGGDFYDFFLIGENKLGFLIADVAGKGIPAALFMMTAKTQIKNYLATGIPVNEALDAANHQLCLGNDAGMFVTTWVGVLDFETGSLSYTNAGHNPPLLHHDEQWNWMRDVSGMPLGLFDGIPYGRFEYQLAAGDTMYLYTDGVTEAMDAGGNLFGEDRLLDTLTLYTGMNARSVSVGIRRAITDFTLDAEQSDDITMVTMRYGVPPEKRAVMVLPADVKQLVHVQNFIHEELHRRNAPKSAYNPLDIAAEELFCNVCHYAYPDAEPGNPGEVRIGFEYGANPPSLTVTISDDGIPYNPLAKSDAVAPDDIATAPIGGLGILMAKNSVDDMSYERVDDTNVLTFRKIW